MQISVILPTYNPRLEYIQQVLAALNGQTLDKSRWELIIVDNNSNNNVLSQTDLSWHRQARIVQENRQGLTYSRICGFEQAVGEIIMMADDDNLLHPTYLEQVGKHFSANTRVGAMGGKIEASFPDYQPAEWVQKFYNMLAIRNLGDVPLISDTGLQGGYPPFAPVGAGMAIRRSLLTAYVNHIKQQKNVISDRTGKSLSSGGDNEINIQVLQQGYAVAYFPDLQLTHIIPAGRVTKKYLAELNYASTKSWVRLLLKYRLSPWKTVAACTVPMRKARAFFTHRPWASPANYVEWHGACGLFDGLAKP